MLLIDWGWPDEARRGLDVAGHVEEIVLPLLASARRAGRSGRLLPRRDDGARGGAAGRRARASRRSPRRGISPAFRTRRAPISRSSGAARSRPRRRSACCRWRCCKAPSGTSIRPAPSPSSRPSRRWTGDEARTFVMLEDWANDGPPVAGGGGAGDVRRLVRRPTSPAAANGASAARTIDPAALACPLLNIVSTTDRIVPAASAPRAGERLDLALGHVGMVVGSRARERALGAAGRLAFAPRAKLIEARQPQNRRLAAYDRRRHHRRQAHPRRLLPRRLRRHARARARPGRDHRRAGAGRRRAGGRVAR